MSHNPRETYTVDFPGLRLEIEAEAYPGQGDPDILGESQFTFQAEDVRALDEDGEPFLFVQESQVRTFETPLVEILADFEDNPPESDEDRAERLAVEEFTTRNVDAAIVALAGIVESARLAWRDSPAAVRAPRTVRVRWYGECSAFWLFHDVTHAYEDVELQAGGGQVRVNGPDAEDRANLEGARRAVKAGMPLGEVLAELAGLRKAFRVRFSTESTALVDFLQDPGDGSGVDVDSMRREFRELVEDFAREVLDEDPDRSEDDAADAAHEHVDGAASSWSFDRCARLLVGADDPRAGEDYADPDNGDAQAMLGSRAFGALVGAVEARVRELHAESRCEDCADRARVDGGTRCARCAADAAESEAGAHADSCPCHACYARR